MAELNVGDVIEVDDGDYRYGTGRLIMRVTTIGNRQCTIDGDWVDLDGLDLRADGTQLGAQPRHAVVRVNALRIRRGPQTRR